MVGDLEDFEEPAIALQGLARDARSADRLLVLAAGAEEADPIRWLWLERGPIQWA